MTKSPINRVVEEVRRAVSAGAEATDAQLLGCFIERRDEWAFEALVRRHGPMVLGVCRRVLGNHHDAEDAFQATFLVLARKADRIAPRVLLPNWLYGVAYQTARKARATAARRRERLVGEVPEPEVSSSELPDDLRALLDQELSRLPQKYRAPLVLCALEGASRREAARQLALSEGTLSSRLARARGMLALRLSRQGLVFSGGVLAVLAPQGLSAQAPPLLVASTVKAVAGMASAPVAALTEGVLRTMCVSKLKWMAVAGLLGLALLVVGAGAVVSGPSAGENPTGPAPKGKAGRAKVRWEYKALTRLEIHLRGSKGDKDPPLSRSSALARGLNALGEEGWELVATDPNMGPVGGVGAGGFGTSTTYVFKRPK